MTSSITHELKILPLWYTMITDGTKAFEIRRNDRDFRVGDIIKFVVVYDDKCAYPQTQYKITCIVDDPEYCKEGYVVFGIEREGSRL